MKARGISQSELARQVGVSRQAVSLWLRQAGQVNVRARHLLRVSSALGVSAEELVESLPCCEPDRRGTLRTRYLWDRLSARCGEATGGIPGDDGGRIGRPSQPKRPGQVAVSHSA